jgi:hypothetical protein
MSVAHGQSLSQPVSDREGHVAREQRTDWCRYDVQVPAPDDRLLGVEFAQVGLECAVPLFLLRQSLETGARVRYVCRREQRLFASACRNASVKIAHSRTCPDQIRVLELERDHASL